MDAVDPLRRIPPVGAEQGGRGEASDDFDGRYPRWIVLGTFVVE
jgi:hypothetical protein